MTRLAFLESATKRLDEAGIESAHRNAVWILEDVTRASHARLLSTPEALLSEGDRQRAEAMIRRRLTGEPIQYVLGHADFMRLRLAVSPAVLIPRPETEEVCEHALQSIHQMDSPWVLDVGTGSGAIALAIKDARPDATVLAVDVSADALAVATSNAVRLGLDVSFIRGDALEPQFADRAPSVFDVIVSNPPYVPLQERESLQPEVRDHEPALALFVDEDPLIFYRALAGHALRLLRPGGRLIAETHMDHGQAAADVFSDAGLVDVSVARDVNGRQRIASARKP